VVVCGESRCCSHYCWSSANRCGFKVDIWLWSCSVREENAMRMVDVRELICGAWKYAFNLQSVARSKSYVCKRYRFYSALQIILLNMRGGNYTRSRDSHMVPWGYSIGGRCLLNYRLKRLLFVLK
jgi:hypothetical protein